jgi:hypothetical protein
MGRWRTAKTTVHELDRRADRRNRLNGCAHLVAKRPVVAAPKLWEPDNKLGRVLEQRRDTPDNEKWSGRWESNPHGRRFRALRTSGLVRQRILSVISV